MSVTIRKATLTDLNELIRWRMKGLREAFSGSMGVNFAQLRRSNLNFYRRAMSMESYLACFADQGYRAVGYGGLCIYHETPTPENPSGSCAYVMNVYTSPSQRAEGVTDRIISWLCSQARKRGINKIYISPRPEVNSLITGEYSEEGLA